MNVYSCFPEGTAKALTMSYDDGRLQDERLVDIFNRNGIKGTFNLNYGLMEKGEPWLARERVRELYQGHEVATHCLTHPTIARCSMVEAAYEILEDRKGLESLTGGLVRGHAYPNGSYSPEIKQLFHQLGIAYARVGEPKGDYELPEDSMEWHPTCHHNDPELMEKAARFANFGTQKSLKLMYVWGHSYEFDDRDNWGVIEEFCRYMGGRQDIWYATNIEIVDYMEALNRLKFSGDNRMVYNPSAVSVWLQIDGKKIVEVKGGTTVNLTK